MTNAEELKQQLKIKTLLGATAVDILVLIYLQIREVKKADEATRLIDLALESITTKDLETFGSLFIYSFLYDAQMLPDLRTPQELEANLKDRLKFRNSQ